MITKTLNKPLNGVEIETVEKNKLPVSDYEFHELIIKLRADVDQAKTVLVHFDHIQGESEYDREQIFSNLLKAAFYFGPKIEKVDFHRQDF
ncbi:MAG: hypothetical protein C0410_04525 [Anaerolinea sp.]|nr:hypothetical protein [Anaerolinea sp.]